MTVENRAGSQQTPNQLPDSSEQERILRAQELGLPEDARWAEIWTYENEQERIAVAQALGLSENASWRKIMVTALGLSTIASPEKIIERIREIKR